MIEIDNKRDCTGCGACKNICPVNAITMYADIEGFKYPKVNMSLCTMCNACEKVCPVLNHEELFSKYKDECNVQKAYAVKNNNLRMRMESSSGGAFSAIAAKFLSDGGVVVGAAFDDQYQIYHKIVQKQSELQSIMGSKYAQSEIDVVFREVKQLLNGGIKVLFSGMSCQIEGLRAFLRKDFDNLYCIDLICMGVPSPKVWKKYLESYFSREKITRINFKDKSAGWHNFSVAMNMKDGKNSIQIGHDNYFMQSMFKGYSIRPSCFDCKFKSVYRAADLTLADCWGAEFIAPEMDDNKGLSTVIIHTSKGMELFQAISDNIEKKEFSLELVVKGNANIIKCAPEGKWRRFFMYTLNHISPRIAFSCMCKNPSKSFIYRVKNKIRYILEK